MREQRTFWLALAIALLFGCGGADGSGNNGAGDAGSDAADSGDCLNADSYVDCMGEDAAYAEYERLNDVASQMNADNVAPGDGDRLNCEEGAPFFCEMPEGQEADGCIWTTTQLENGAPDIVCECGLDLTWSGQRERLCGGE